MSSETIEMNATISEDGTKMDPSSSMKEEMSTSSNEEGTPDEALRPYWSTHGLPDARDKDGRSVWDPPILDYSEYIGEIYEKKREAMLKYFDGDKARTTDIMDADTEFHLMEEYSMWAGRKMRDTQDPESLAFLATLCNEMNEDFQDVQRVWTKQGAYTILPKDDGTYEVVSYGEIWGGDYDTNDGEDGQNIDVVIMPKLGGPPFADHDPISGPNDDAEELAWLDSLDAQASATNMTSNMPPVPPTPLALHLVSLLSHAPPIKSDGRSASSSNEDDID